jgi:hypothetical protein
MRASTIAPIASSSICGVIEPSISAICSAGVLPAFRNGRGASLGASGAATGNSGCLSAPLPFDAPPAFSDVPVASSALVTIRSTSSNCFIVARPSCLVKMVLRMSMQSVCSLFARTLRKCPEPIGELVTGFWIERPWLMLTLAIDYGHGVNPQMVSGMPEHFVIHLVHADIHLLPVFFPARVRGNGSPQ